MLKLNVLTTLVTIFIIAFVINIGYAIQLAPETYQNDLSKPDPLWTANDDLWKFEDDILTGQTTEKEKWDRFYSCKYYAGGDYEISVRIKYNKFDEYGGGGLIFNSESNTDCKLCMMARFHTDKAVASGYFTSNGNYQEHQLKDIEGGLDDNWHTLKIHVKGNEKKYDVYVDGKLMLEGLELNFDRGYFGLIICNGNISYKNFLFKQLAPAKPRTEFKTSKWSRITPKKKLLDFDMLTGSLLTYNENGDLDKSFNIPGGIKAFASNRKGEIAAFSLDGAAVRIYDKKGKDVGNIELKTSDGKAIEGPVSAMLDDKGYLFVMTNQPKALYRLRAKNQTTDIPLKTSEEDAELVDFSIHGKYLYVVDNKGYVYIYKTANLRSKHRLVNIFRASGGGEIRGITCDAKNIFIIEGNKVVKYSVKGEKLEIYRGWKLAKFSPITLQTGKKGRLYVIDRANNCVITLSKVFNERFPQVTFTSPTSAEITWTNAYPSTGALKLYRDENLLKSFLDKKTSRKHTIRIDNIEPNTRYEYSISPQAYAMPDTLAERKHPMLTPAGRGKTQYLNYPIAVLLFTDVIDDEKQTEDWPDTMKPLSRKEIDRFKREISHCCKVYYMNSHMKYNPEPHFYIVDDKYKRSDVFKPGRAHHPKEELIEEVLKKHNKSPEDYNCVIYVPAVQKYNEKTKDYYVRGYGGGFTIGTDGKKYGKCWWEMTCEDHGSGNDWLMLHEFNHQTDAMMAAGGHKEYWYNHYSLFDDCAEKFYLLYDADTYLIRETTPPEWWLHGIGEIKITEDRDEDGIPDNDLNVWMDERRMGTNPFSKDTDDDGLTDMEEVLSWNNSNRGCTEDYGGRKLFPDPTRSDSDGDGIPDNKDPFPICTIKFEIPKTTHDIQKPFNPNNWTMLYSLEDPRINYKVYANWDNNYFYVAIETQKESINCIALDATADGWFIGPDNYCFQWGFQGRDFRDQLYNCLDPTKLAIYDRKLIEGDYTYRFEEKGDRKILLFSLKKNQNTGLDLQSGDIMALRIISGPAPNPDGYSRYISYFEPNKFMDFKLVEK